MATSNLTDEEIKLLESAQNKQEWNNARDHIKSARKGEYPADWHTNGVVLATASSNCATVSIG